jgi:CoA-transferase family III
VTTIWPIWPSVSFRRVAPLCDHCTVVDHHDRGQVKLSLRISKCRAPRPPLCRALERPDLIADPRFDTTDKRRARATELAAILDPIFAAQPWLEWRRRLREGEITFGLLGVLRDVPDDEQAVANGSVVPTRVEEMPTTLSAYRRDAGRTGLRRCRDREAARGRGAD